MALRRREKKLSGDPLRIRVFSREMKKALIGYVGKKPDYPDLSIELHKKVRGVNPSAWNDWWHGKRLPNKTYRDIFDEEFNGLASMWLYPHLNRHRMATHFTALDLESVRMKDGHAYSIDVAWQILSTIHRDWQPGPWGVMSIPTMNKRGGIHLSKNEQTSASLDRNKQKVEYSSVEFDLVKGPRSKLSKNATSSHFLYEPLNPSSILIFMLGYAAETNLIDPGLKKAFVFDLLTANIAIGHIIQVMTSSNIIECGQTGMIFRALVEHFWDEDYGNDGRQFYRKHPVDRLVETLHERQVEFDSDIAGELFHRLKCDYYKSLAITGLDEVELMTTIHEHVCSGTVLGQSK